VTIAVPVNIADSLVELIDDNPAERSRNPARKVHAAGPRLVGIVEHAPVAFRAGHDESEQVGAHDRLDHRVAGDGLRLTSPDISADYFS